MILDASGNISSVQQSECGSICTQIGRAVKRRYIETFCSVGKSDNESICTHSSNGISRRSSIESIDTDSDVIIPDGMGEIKTWYEKLQREKFKGIINNDEAFIAKEKTLGCTFYKLFITRSTITTRIREIYSNIRRRLVHDIIPISGNGNDLTLNEGIRKLSKRNLL